MKTIRKLHFQDEPIITQAALLAKGDGRHLVDNDFQGLSVYATVKAGKIVDYEVDHHGKAVEVSLYHVHETPVGGSVRGEKQREPKVTCWLCACSGDPPTCTCRQVPCPGGR